MAFMYTTGRGETYYLHTKQVPLRDGQAQQVHYFAPVLNPDEAVEALPAGYSVAETRGAVRLVRSSTAERIQAGIEEYGSARKARRADERRKRAEARARSGRVDWLALALDAGLVDPDGGLLTREHTLRALELIVGDENVRAAVDLRLNFDPGWPLAEQVLRSIRSELATDLAYEAYRTAAGDRAVQAVALIAAIGHPKALARVEEFLRDERVALLGITLLDALVSRREIDAEDERVGRLLELAESHSNEAVRDGAASVRKHPAGRGGT